MTSTPITLFTWGYWGWGSATREFVEAATAVEAARGFDRPLFVDLRRLRQVRAAGFRGDAFEKAAGKDSYRWMPSLGNLAVETGTGPAIQIAEPAAAHELLDLAVEAASARRRIIAFCACEFPAPHDPSCCHRVTVAELVRAAASERGVDLETVEWPGGEASLVDIEVDEKIARAVVGGTRTSIPLGKGLPPVRLCGLAQEAPVRIGTRLVLARAARAGAGGWVLPIAGVFEDGTTVEEALEVSREARVKFGLVPVRAASSGSDVTTAPAEAATRPVHPACIYTIAHGDKLREVAATGGRGTFEEKRPWATGARLLAQAHEQGKALAVVFADATDCVDLLYWGVLTGISVHEKGTTFSVEGLRPIRGRHVTQELRLLSSGKPIAEGYIRPYAPCHTPLFL